MTFQIRPTWELRRCPECGQGLPRDWDWDVRSLAWMHDLPRSISPSNNDLTIHDGGDGRNRFLTMEFKRDSKPLSVGQERHLLGLSGFEKHGVLLVRGKQVDRVTIQQARGGRWFDPIRTTCEAINGAVSSWLRGRPWSEGLESIRSAEQRHGVPDGKPGHTHGYSQTAAGEFTCIQDYYAAGHDPESGCGHVFHTPSEGAA